MNFKQLSLFFLIFALSLSLFAQKQSEQRISQNGKIYLLHFVKKGETIFSLAQTYQVSEKEIVAANPDLIAGLKEGSTIKIPENKKKDYIEIKLKRKRTVFFLAREYQVSVGEIYEYNPGIRKKVKAGKIVRIPVKNQDSEATVELPEESITQPRVEKPTAKPDQAEESIKNNERFFSSKFFYHRIEAGETLFELEKKYGISKDSLLALNPGLQKGLVPGFGIQVPINNLPKVSVQPYNEDEFIHYTVKANETIYTLAKQFHLTVPELKTANPDLQYRDLIIGDELLIPNKSLRHKEFDENAEDSVWVYPDYRLIRSFKPHPVTCISEGRNDGQLYQVALMLPLFLNANSTINYIQVSKEELLADTVFMSTYKKGMPIPTDSIRIREDKIIDPHSENFMHLYEGVLLAADSLRRQGMNLRLYVFDTNRDPRVIDSLLQLNVFRNMDLIIGPVYPTLQQNVSAFSRENQIPMVSPLASAGNYEENNPFYFKVSPNKDYLIKETAKLITDNYFDKNFIILKMGNYDHLQEANLVSLTRSHLFSTGYYGQCKDALFHEYDFNKEGLRGLQHIILPDRENVFIIPSIDEGKMSVAITNLNTLSEEADIRLIGLSHFKNYRSIQPEYFHHTQLQYYTHYYVDYQDVGVNRFIAAFKNQFGTEPNEFSFQGFDVAYYFMSALNQFGRNFTSCIHLFKIKQNQLNLSFRRVNEAGGFMNYGLFDITYQKDYSVTNNGTYSPVYIAPEITSQY